MGTELMIALVVFLIAAAWFAGRSLAPLFWGAEASCVACHGPLEGAKGPECADDGCPARWEHEGETGPSNE